MLMTIKYREHLAPACIYGRYVSYIFFQVISEHFIKSNHDGLQGMFNKIIQFIPLKCKLLADVTSGAAVG